jgi:nucleoside-diphosphate-sugar epimerase
MNSIVIHGASSFLGNNFIKLLISQKINVHIIARATSQITFCENWPTVKIYRYNKTISEINCQNIIVKDPVFFEFSWHGVFGTDRNIPEQLSVNIPLIISSIAFAKRLNAKHWIGIGSQAEYGDLNKEITENDKCNPTTFYGKSKLLCSKISEELCQAYSIEHSWLRLFSVFGPNDNHDWLIPFLIKGMLNDNEINVTKGEQFWDYLYIDDISEMLLKMISASGIGIANLGSGQPIQIRQIIEKIKIFASSNSIINYGAIPYRPDQVMYMSANIIKLSTHLNWQPKTSIDEGLIKTIDFFKNNK